MKTMRWTKEGGPAPLPILAGFVREIVPALLLLWAGLIVAYLVTGRD